MCLPVSRLFWVSSLAYPNLLGTKGYVVVVVVVVVVLEKHSANSTLCRVFLVDTQQTSHLPSANVPHSANC
jgi:hypothetical protein